MQHPSTCTSYTYNSCSEMNSDSIKWGVGIRVKRNDLVNSFWLCHFSLWALNSSYSHQFSICWRHHIILHFWYKLLPLPGILFPGNAFFFLRLVPKAALSVKPFLTLQGRIGAPFFLCMCLIQSLSQGSVRIGTDVDVLSVLRTPGGWGLYSTL